MKFNEAFKDCPKVVQSRNKKFQERLIGRKIVDIEYGLDADEDPEIYRLILDNGVKISIARVFPDGKIAEEERTRRYADGAILRFLFLNWKERRAD